MPAFNIAYAALLASLTEIAAAAARSIGEFGASAAVRRKPDGSPVTAADEAAEAVICESLARVAPGVPIISEEAASRGLSRQPSGTELSRGYFLVDPLDGTREFVAGSDEYTVNIAFMVTGQPVVGVIAAPASGIMWRGIVGHGADRLGFLGSPNAAPKTIRTRPRPPNEPVIMVSRSHLEARTRAFVEAVVGAKRIPCGSSLKFCRLAEGDADLYPRLAPTHDWDIAAGHAVLKAAGGDVHASDGSPLVYGTPDLLIPEFIATGSPAT